MGRIMIAAALQALVDVALIGSVIYLAQWLRAVDSRHTARHIEQLQRQKELSASVVRFGEHAATLAESQSAMHTRLQDLQIVVSLMEDARRLDGQLAALLAGGATPTSSDSCRDSNPPEGERA
ncbi:hypothetical protein [Actinomadura sp. NPDC048394]|uniref:hypothetical protein n=1 Tax=Actinomadura sp. NPDC048394 TaxID=3158223 RepID=UPI003401470B